MVNQPNHKILQACLVLCMAAGCTPSIHDVAARGDVEPVKAMLAGDPGLVHARNGMEKTPLHYAVTSRRKDVTAFLLDAGADINAVDKTGLTALHITTLRHSPDRIDEAAQLLDAGADLEAKDAFGDTPLHSAAMHGKLKILDYLVERGADVHATNAAGLTPLELAKKHRRTDAAKRLETLMSR